MNSYVSNFRERGLVLGIRAKNEMNIVFMEDGSSLSIEQEQSNTRDNIIEQYISRRKELGLTQCELAQRAGMARENITRFESRNHGKNCRGFRDGIADSVSREIKLIHIFPSFLHILP